MKVHTKIKLICVSILLLVLVGNLQTANANKISMAYLYGNYDYISLIERNENALNVVSPSYFDLNSNGNLILNSVDKNLVDEMHKKGIKVTPFLSNHWDKSVGRAALSNIEKLTNDIVSAINKYNLDGINVDIENVTEIDRNNYTKLVRVLREKLPKGKIVSVAVAANPYNWQTGWHGSYDYQELAKYADYLVLMAYDEHYESGDAGPVASINFVEKSIQYALTKVDKSKIVIGIPFYGRYWKNGASYGGYGVSLTKIEEIIGKYDSKIEYDKESQSVKAIVKIKDADKKPVINGRTLYAGEYTFWYENETSIREKLELVNKYDIKGSGSWSLGQELGSTWDYYKEVLNIKENTYVGGFDDVIDSHWAKDAIKFVKQNGYMNGKSSNHFGLTENLTRAEMATIITRILGKTNEMVSKVTYNDTYGHWAQNEIEVIRNLGIMQGGTNNNFRPNDYITREEVAKVFALLDIKNNKKLENISFADVTENRWSYNYIIDIARKGLITGYENNTFMPRKNISRAEISIIMERAFK